MQSVPHCTAFTVYMHSVVLPPNYPQFHASTRGHARLSRMQAVSSLCILCCLCRIRPDQRIRHNSSGRIN